MSIKQAAQDPTGERIAIDSAAVKGMSIADTTFASLPAAVQTSLGAGGAGLQASTDFRSGQVQLGPRWVTVWFSRAATAAGDAVT